MTNRASVPDEGAKGVNRSGVGHYDRLATINVCQPGRERNRPYVPGARYPTHRIYRELRGSAEEETNTVSAIGTVTVSIGGLQVILRGRCPGWAGSLESAPGMRISSTTQDHRPPEVVGLSQRVVFET